MKAYWHYWQKDKQKQLGISVFRVLTLTEKQGRKESLRGLTKQAGDTKQGSEMFWFACEKSFDLAKPKTILDPIWQTPKNDTLHHLLE